MRSAIDDGTVGCTVSDVVAGWRHECALCSTCIFNVHLLAHCPERYELCVDCWSGAMRDYADPSSNATAYTRVAEQMVRAPPS